MAYMQFDTGEVFQTDSPEYWKEAKRLPDKAGKAAYAASEAKQLRTMLSPGDTVYCVLRSRASSGMSRQISFLIVHPGNENSKGKPYLRNITHAVGAIVGYREGKDGGLVIGGGGMDMGFATVYSLGASLWPDGTPEPHGMRNGVPDSDGGYALGHSWI